MTSYERFLAALGLMLAVFAFVGLYIVFRLVRSAVRQARARRAWPAQLERATGPRTPGGRPGGPWPPIEVIYQRLGEQLGRPAGVPPPRAIGDGRRS